jgi:hydrogenase maturation protein HypF
MIAAVERRRVLVRGIVQGVGFRPFVFNLAQRHGLSGSVTNSSDGVEIIVQGRCGVIEAFVAELLERPPAAARIDDVQIERIDPGAAADFHIRDSERSGPPSTQVSPDLPVCDQCVRELFDPSNRRFRYPYINCASCGPRFSLVRALPYDRESTTMAAWRMCAECLREFHDPTDRRFHAQPIACPRCGPRYRLSRGDAEVFVAHDAIVEAVRLLRGGAVLAIKGIGGYHLACDARHPGAVGQLRERKYRKERPFALLVKDLSVARALTMLNIELEALLTSPGRPIVLAPARVCLEGVAPDHQTLGVMLPYTPLHYLMLAAGAPDALVMTSGNRSSEPIAFEDGEARTRLHGIADAFLIGERPIANRVDDSVAQATAFGPMILRRSRGYAPAAVARLNIARPILAVGGDLKNTVALATAGRVLVSQHIGDLDDQNTRVAFTRTIESLLDLYEIDPLELVVVHDAHPEYASTLHARDIPACRHEAVQHHCAHVASVLAERQALNTRVVGVAFDGSGFGDDGTIWGGEFLVGSVAEGFDRVAHLRPALLPGGDGAALFPVQAAAGFLGELEDVPDLTKPPFLFPKRYVQARELVRRRIRTFATTSVGRLFDTAAALLGFTGPISFEAQAAIWLEQRARTATRWVAVPFEFTGAHLDFRPALQAIIRRRVAGDDIASIALGFHRGLADAIAKAAAELCAGASIDTVALSGGVFQNQVLLRALKESAELGHLAVWTHQRVPAGDGGLSLGQAALAAARVQRAQ